MGEIKRLDEQLKARLEDFQSRHDSIKKGQLFYLPTGKDVEGNPQPFMIRGDVRSTFSLGLNGKMCTCSKQNMLTAKPVLILDAHNPKEHEMISLLCDKEKSVRNLISLSLSNPLVKKYFMANEDLSKGEPNICHILLSIDDAQQSVFPTVAIGRDSEGFNLLEDLRVIQGLKDCISRTQLSETQKEKSQLNRM